MKKIFQKWTILSASEESLAITGLFESIQSQDSVKLLSPVLPS
jgi:hypothetical protein